MQSRRVLRFRLANAILFILLACFLLALAIGDHRVWEFHLLLVLMIVMGLLQVVFCYRDLRRANAGD